MRSHLRVDIDAYDASIRNFIPGYEEGLNRAAGAIAAVRPGLVLDLGAGTGALSEAILEREEVGALEAIDIDPEMLARARTRLQRFGDRARFREGSFDDALPACDAVAASLALHHVPTMEGKGELYRRIYLTLRPGGLFVNADVTISADPPERERNYKSWARHMVACGIDERRAWKHFDEWAEEDTYFPLEDELAAMRDAGFDAACIWRHCPNTLLVGRNL